MTEPMENKKETQKLSPQEIAIGLGFWVIVFFVIVLCCRNAQANQALAAHSRKDMMIVCWKNKGLEMM